MIVGFTADQLKVGLSLSYAALLPAGTDETMMVQTIAYVRDQHRAEARAAALVQVETREFTTKELANLTGALLYAAFDTDDTESVYQALNSAGTLMAKANCSVDCAALNRSACSSKQPTLCGDCLYDLVGPAAPSVGSCRDPSDAGIGGGLEEACDVDGDCVEEYCEDGLCASPPLGPDPDWDPRESADVESFEIDEID